MECVDCRVLSIQSHVVHGYVGNRAAVLPLQCLGFDVDFINSVQFSNSTAYTHWKGQILDSRQVHDLMDGLRLNELCSYSHLLTGYVASESCLKEIAKIVESLRQSNPKLYYVCDPVLGDNGQYYVPKELMVLFRDLIIPLADVITPNQFELEMLSGIHVLNEGDCLKAMESLTRKGPKIVVVTSSQLGSDANKIFGYGLSLNNGGERLRFSIPKLPAQFYGTGDLFSALLLANIHLCQGLLKQALQKTLASIQDVLRVTLAHANKISENPGPNELELRLVKCRQYFESPECQVDVTEIL